MQFKGFSKLSGDYYVEDVTRESITRRLIFQNIESIIQTEIVLKKGKLNNLDKIHLSNYFSYLNIDLTNNMTPDYKTFIEDYFLVLVSRLYLLSKTKSKINILREMKYILFHIKMIT